MQWSANTPDGRRLVVSREGGVWAVACGEAEPVRSELLDIALAKAIRGQDDVRGHSKGADYASWTRELADRLERVAEWVEGR
jgi:hypothetical protein